jgi:hypothetical protein
LILILIEAVVRGDLVVVVGSFRESSGGLLDALAERLESLSGLRLDPLVIVGQYRRWFLGARSAGNASVGNLSYFRLLSR